MPCMCVPSTMCMACWQDRIELKEPQELREAKERHPSAVTKRARTQDTQRKACRVHRQVV